MSCPNADAVITALSTGLTGPLKVEADGLKVEQHPIGELIAAHQYLSGICAANNRTRGLRFNKFIPPGTVYSSIRLLPPRW